MALPVKDQLRYWGIAIAVLVLALWFLGHVLLPFVLGGALAYCLDPIADRLERLGLGRLMAVIVITFVALIVFVLTALWVLPTLVNQATALFESAPEIVRNLQAWLAEKFPEIIDEGSALRQSLDKIGAQLQEKGGAVLNQILSSALGLVNVLVILVLVPVITFYLLLDWDRMLAKVNAVLPLDHAPAVRKIASDIDKTLASFIRGQGTVCLILGSYYGIALMIAGLQFGLVVGFVAGLISFIPYVGALVGGVLAIGLALFQFWGDWWMIAIIAAIFFVGQMLEGNILTPNLVGQSVGLHPVWLIFALSVFGTLFGFVGMLVAVPLAASIGVLARFGIAEYLESLLYKGKAGRNDE
jgi:predicted PurR-regulated permease PerM